MRCAMVQGEWKPKKIKNPAYKGKWVHPEIDNPEYVADSNLCKFTDIDVLGFDLWQVKAGTIFDNVLVAVGEANTPVDEAKKHADDTWAKTKVAEKTMKDEIDEKEKKAQEEADKKKKEEGVLSLPNLFTRTCKYIYSYDLRVTTSCTYLIY